MRKKQFKTSAGLGSSVRAALNKSDDPRIQRLSRSVATQHGRSSGSHVYVDVLIGSWRLSVVTPQEVIDVLTAAGFDAAEAEGGLSVSVTAPIHDEVLAARQAQENHLAELAERREANKVAARAAAAKLHGALPVGLRRVAVTPQTSRGAEWRVTLEFTAEEAAALAALLRPARGNGPE